MWIDNNAQIIVCVHKKPFSFLSPRFLVSLLFFVLSHPLPRPPVPILGSFGPFFHPNNSAREKITVAMPYTNVVFNGAYWKSFTHRPRYTHDDIPDLTGKVAIVTGANSGLGYATTVALAARGAHVFLACRAMGKALEAIEKAKAEIKTKYPQFKGEPNFDFLALDLNDMKKCQHAAQEFLKRGLPLHILVNNGGIMTSPFALSADDIEQQFAVNHMG